jgi:2'-5' RNA ligase
MSNSSETVSTKTPTQPDVTGLVVLVSEADALVQSFRRKYDPVAVKGVPAHVTILFPFMHPDALNEIVLAQLQHIALSNPSFDFALTGLGRFPTGIYLIPEPVQPFINLTESVHSAFPDYPPYEGQFLDIIPHLTLAHQEDQQLLDQIEHAFADKINGALPLRAKARHIVLMESRQGRWRKHTTFGLGN